MGKSLVSCFFETQCTRRRPGSPNGLRHFMGTRIRHPWTMDASSLRARRRNRQHAAGALCRGGDAGCRYQFCSNLLTERMPGDWPILDEQSNVVPYCVVQVVADAELTVCCRDIQRYMTVAEQQLHVQIMAVFVYFTRGLHFTAGCTTGCTTGCMNTDGCTTGMRNYANEPAKRRLSGPVRTLMKSLGWHAARRLCEQ